MATADTVEIHLLLTGSKRIQDKKYIETITVDGGKKEDILSIGASSVLATSIAGLKNVKLIYLQSDTDLKLRLTISASDTDIPVNGLLLLELPTATAANLDAISIVNELAEEATCELKIFATS